MLDQRLIDGLPAVVVSGLVGVFLWFGFAPASDATGSDQRAGTLGWITVAAAMPLGMVFGRRRAGHIALGVTLAQVVLALFLAPRGDGDGLWILWIPYLLVLGGFLIIPAWMGGWARARVVGS